MYHAERCVRSGHFALDHDVDLDCNIGVQHDSNGVLANSLERTVGQANLRLGDLETILDETSSDVHGSDETEQTTVYTCLFEHVQRVARQLLAQLLCFGELLGLLLLELGAACFEFLDGGFGSTAGDALR